MNPPRDLQVLLVADFTADGLAAMLRQQGPGPNPGPRLVPTVTGIAESVPTLLHPPSAPGDQPWDLGLVWIRPGTALPSLAGPFPAPDAAERLAEEVSRWAEGLRHFAAKVTRLFVVGWSPDPAWMDRGALTAGGRLAAPLLLQEAQARLARALSDLPHLTLLDPAPWLESAGDEAHVPSLWYLAKVPFGPRVLRAANRTIRSHLRRLASPGAGPGPVKLIVVDLDDTLWGGTLGEVGWDKLRVGGHDAIGEAHADFQRGLRALASRGVLLAIASRNDEANALDALRRHPDMVLRPEDFVTWRINWEDKAANIAAMLAELNLGPQSTLFLDNDPAQRERVRGAFPDLVVPDLPEDPVLYPRTLATLDVFDAGPATEEDRQRAELYARRRAAESDRGAFGSVDAWIASLDTEVTFEPVNPTNRSRALQLLNKTNQMNLRTRRLTEPEFDAWCAAPGREFWTVRVRDRFGDAGLTGLLGLETTTEPASVPSPEARAGTGAATRVLEIADFVLSCRVMGRGIEEAMAAWATERAAALGCQTTRAIHLPTERNEPCLKFWRERSAFHPAPDTLTFLHAGPAPRPRPDGIRISLPS